MAVHGPPADHRNGLAAPARRPRARARRAAGGRARASRCPRRPARRRAAPGADRATSRTSAFAALNTALFEDALVRRDRDGRRDRRADRGSLRRGRPRPCPEVAYPRLLVLAGERSQASIVETLHGRRPLPSPTPSPRSSSATARSSSTTSSSGERGGAATSMTLAVAPGRATSRFTSHNVALGGALARTDLDVGARRRGRRVRAERPLPRPGPPAPRQPHRRSTTRRRTARAASSTRASWTARRAASSTARSSCGRTPRRPTRCRRTRTCSSRARRSSTRRRRSRSSPTTSSASTARRPASSTPTAALLPALARHRRGRGAGAPDLGVRRRRRRADPGPRRAAPRRARARPAPAGRRGRGGRMSTAVREARRRPPPTTSRPSAGTSRSSRRRSTASRSSTSTTPPRRRSRCAVIDAERRRLRDVLRQHPPRRPLALGPRDRRLRRRAREGARRSSTPREAHEIVFVRGTTEAINLVAQTYGRAHVGAGDEVLITGARAPLEHRALADALRGEGRAARGRADRRTRARSTSTALEKLLTPRTQHRLGRPRLQRARHGRSRSGGSSSSRTRAASRSSWTARRRRRACPSTCGRSTATSTPSRATRSTGRRASACSTARPRCSRRCRPYQGGGDMIRSVTFEKTTYNALPYKFEAGTPNIAGGIAFGAALDYVGGARPRRAIAAHEHDLLAYATERALGDPGPARSSARRARRRASSPSCSTASTRTTSARCSTARASRSAPATTARSRSWTASACRRRRAPPSASTTRAREVDALVAGDPQSHRDVPLMTSDLRDLYQEVILDHSKRPRNFRALAGAEPQGRGLQPALRRPGDGLPRARRRRAAGRRLPGRRLRDLDRLGLDDDREPQGQDARRGRGALRALPRPHHRPARPGRRRRPSSASSRCSRACASTPCGSSARRCRGTR